METIHPSKEELLKLDASIHSEVMGAKWFFLRRDSGYTYADGKPLFTEIELHTTPKDASKYELKGWSVSLINTPIPWRPSGCPSYSANKADSWLVEEKIKQKKLEEAYGEALVEICKSIGVNRPSFSMLAFYLAHASPRTRCCAALVAVRKAK